MTEQELKDVKDLENLDVKKFEKLIEKENSGTLKMRLHSAQGYLNKLSLEATPLATPEERITIKQKIQQKINILQFQITKKEQEEDKRKFQLEQTQDETWLKENWRDLRYCTGAVVQGFSNGTYTLDILPFQKVPENLKIKVKCESGKEIECNLTKLSSTHIRRLREKILSPLILTLEGGGMSSGHGKVRNQYWYPSEYNEVKDDRVIQPTLIALMLV